MPLPKECEVYHPVCGCDEYQKQDKSLNNAGFVTMFEAINHVLDAPNGCSG